MGGVFQPIFFASIVLCPWYRQQSLHMPFRHAKALDCHGALDSRRRGRQQAQQRQADTLGNCALAIWQSNAPSPAWATSWWMSSAAPRGLLRVFIDRPLAGSRRPASRVRSTVEDCERVTRQLQYVLEVEGCRLRAARSVVARARPAAEEARPTTQRFAGQEVDLTLKLPFQGRKNYRGLLLRGDGGGWRLVLNAGNGKGRAGTRFHARRSARGPPGAGDGFQGPRVEERAGADVAGCRCRRQ